jgi:hypothetical protein
MKSTSKSSRPSLTFKSNEQNFIEYLASVFLWQERIPPKVYFVLFVAGRLQLASIIIWTQFYFTTNHSELDFLTNFLGQLTSMLIGSSLITKSSDNDGYDFKITCTFIYWIFLLVIVGILFFGFSLKKKFQKVETLYCLMGSLHNEIIYWFINLICLKALRNEEFQYKLFGNQVSNTSVFSYIVISLMLLLNFMFCAISLVFRFDPFKTHNLMSCWVPSCQMVTGSIKTLQSIILICFSKQNSTAIWFWILTAAAVSTQKYTLHHQFPFYHKFGMITALILNSVTLITTFPALGLSLFSGIEGVSELFPIYIELMLVLIVIKIGVKTYEKQRYEALTNLINQPKCEEDVFKTLQIVTGILDEATMSMSSIGKIKSVDECYFYSILKIHQISCEKKGCLCSKVLSIENEPFSMRDAKIQITTITEELLFNFFKTSAKQLKSHRVQIYLCYLELQRSKSGTRALVTLFNIP